MFEQSYTICDLCRSRIEHSDSTGANTCDLSAFSDKRSIVWGYCHNRCVEKAIEIIRKEFPRDTPAVVEKVKKVMEAEAPKIDERR